MIYVTLAAYNEEKNIGDLLKAIDEMQQREGLQIEIVIVNDGSTDETAKRIQESGTDTKIHIIDQSNAGFLKALEKALRKTLDLAKSGDICITMDADNTHPADLIPQMLKEIQKGEDVVIASRFQKGGGMIGVPRHRTLLSWGARIFMRVFVSVPHVQDYSVSFRAYRVAVLRKVFSAYPSPLAGRGFAGIAGLLLRLSYFTDRIKEVPLLLRYDLKQSQSRLKIGCSIGGYFDIAFGRLLGTYKPK